MIKKSTGVERGQCYNNAIYTQFLNQDWTLVHGICVLTGGPHRGETFGHAWLEKIISGLNYVYDPTSDHLLMAAVYYHAGQISYTHRYEFAESRLFTLKEGHGGPWDEKINGMKHKEDETG